MIKMTPEELGKFIKTEFDKAIQPYLQVKRPEGEVDPKSEGQFKTFGDFLQAVCYQGQAIAEYKEKTLSMDSDPGGGYRVPEGFLDLVLKVASEDGIVRPLATILPADAKYPDQEVNIPVLNQVGAAEKDMFSGVWFQWTNEGGAKPDKEPEFDSIKLAPEEYSASTIITDKLIRNVKTMEAFVKAIYSRAQIAFEDTHFLTGNGVNKPLGVINSPAYILATRTGAGIVYADILAMMAQILPGCKPIWVISRSALAAVVGLVDAAGNSIFIQGDATKKISDRLMGYPIRWTFRVPALGTAGDISLVDLSYYLIKDGYGPSFDTSKHVYFASNKTMLKMFANVDGQPWMNGTITAEDDTTEISPFVGLENA